MRKVIEEFIEHYENQTLEGYSVYDAFNSPLEFILKLNNRYLNIAITQFYKNFPLNVRRISLVKKSINPKSLGLALEGAVVNNRNTDFINQLLWHIKQTRSSFENWSWGYNWHYYTLRGGSFPKHYPNAITTYFIAQGLIQYYSFFPDEEIERILNSIEAFFLEDIRRTEYQTGICFSYSPCDEKQIYNASALITKFLIDKNNLFKENKNLNIIENSFSYLISKQTKDGSWYYGEETNQRWIDSYHTEYILELFETEYSLRSGYSEALCRAEGFYLKNFLLEDKICNYYPLKKYPVNIHSVASMIIFLSKYHDYTKAIPIIEWTLKHLYNYKKHEFYFSKNRFYTNMNVYHRWNQSWMYLALNHFLSKAKETILLTSD